MRDAVRADGGTAPPGVSSPPRTVRLRPRSGFERLLSPEDLWHFRDVAWQIAVRDVKIRYRQTALGAAWAILQPVGTTFVFTIFFGRVAGITSDGVPYWQFSLAGLVPWSVFANAVLLGADSVARNGPLVSKIYFPRIFLPIGVLCAGLLDLAIAFVLLLVVLGAAGVTPTAAILAVPLLVAIMLVAALGITSALSALNVRYRDVRYVVPFAVQLWLFATPIAYPLSLVHSPWRILMALNPMTGVVEGFRWAMLGEIAAPWTLIGVSALSAAVLFVVGLVVFGRAERSFADLV